MGGDITVTSQKGKGSIFRVEISQVETHDAQTAEGLRELAERYDYEAILGVLPGAST